MTATQKVYDVLKAAAGVIALVPAARIKPAGDWQNLAKPYIVHFPVPGTEPTRTHDGPKALRFQRYQLSLFAADEGSVQAIATAVIAALDGYYDDDVSLIMLRNSFSMGYDTDLKVAQYVVEVELAGALT